MADSLRFPKCFYHPNQNITSICLHTQCILPLCQECIYIHRKQFPKGEHASKNIPLREAKNIAISAISTEKQSLGKELKQFNSKFTQFRNDIKSVIEKTLDSLENKLKNQVLHYETNIINLEEKIEKIKSNNLKQLINHYENGNVFTNSIKKFIYSIHNNSITNLLDQSVSFKTQQNQDNSLGETKKFGSSLLHNSAVCCFAQTSHIGGKQKNDTPVKQNKTVNMQQSLTTKRKSTRQGIFVASSPHHMRKLGRYSSTQIKSRRNANEQEFNDNLYGSEFKTRTQAEPFTPISKTYLHKSLIKPQSERNPQSSCSKSQVFPKRVIISRESSTSKRRLQLESKIETKQKDWRDVVNKSDIASNSSSSRLIIKRSDCSHFQSQSQVDCLNPQEMRQLIMKKRANKTCESSLATVSKILNNKLDINLK